MATKKSQPQPNQTSISHCNFTNTAESGATQPPEVCSAVIALAEALSAQAKAVSDLAFVLKGTSPGICNGPGLNISQAPRDY